MGDLRELAKQMLGPALAGPGFAHIAQLIVDGPGAQTEAIEGGKVVWVDRLDRFKWACEFAANRIGLQAITQQQVDVKGSSREVVVVAGGLGWPGVAGATEAPAAGDGDHDDRREQRTVQ